MLQRFLLVWLVASSGLAFYWTQMFPLAPDVWGDKQWIPGYLNPLIALTMFAIGLMLPSDEIRQVFRRWPTVLGGTAIQYTTMPLLAFLVATVSGLEGPQFIGVIMVGCVPGAMASNVLTLNARGNTSYSVSLTTAATLLSPLAVPLALALTLSGDQAVNRSVLIKSGYTLLLYVVLPVIVGHLFGRWGSQFKNWETNCHKYGSIVANIVILVIIAAVVGLTRDQLRNSSVALIVLLLIVNCGGYLAGYVGGCAMRLPEPMRRALTLEIGMQNAGLGSALALTLFADQPTAAIAPAMYTFGCMLTGTALARAWATLSQNRADTQAKPLKDRA